MKRCVSMVLVSFLVTVLMLVAGCGNSSVSKVPMGRYVEKELEVPGELWGMMAQEGNAFIGASNEQNPDEVIIYSLSKEGTWKEERRIEITVPEDYDYGLSSAMDSKGLLYVYVTKEKTVGIARNNFDGTTHSTILQEQDGPYKFKDTSSFTIEQAENGDYIVQGEWSDAVKSFDGESGKIKNMFTTSAISFQTVRDKLYVAETWDNPNINTYDIETGNLLESTEYPIQSNGNVISCNEEGIYLVNSQGIEHKNLKGQIWESIVEPSMTSFNDTSQSPWQMLILKDGTYIVLFAGRNGFTLCQYTFDASITSRPDKEVTVYMNYDVDLIRQAVAIYQKQHTDVYVNVKLADPDIPIKEAIASVNTELMAGNGPDLMILDSLPIEAYMDKGLLMDLSDVVNMYEQSGRGYSNILSTFKKGDAVYAIPLRFKVPFLWGKADVIHNAHSLHELAEYKRQQPDEILFNKNMVELYEQISNFSIPSLVDKDGNYNREKAKVFIEDLETISKKKETGEIYERVDFEEDKFPELLDVAEGKSQVFILEPRNVFDVLGADSILKARGNGQIIPLQVDGQILYKPRGIMGINANSKNADIAKEIIKIALSAEIQGEANWLGIPPSENDLKLQEKNAPQFTDAISDDSGRRVEIDGELGNTYEKYKQYIKEASLYCKSDEELAGLMYEAVKAYSEEGKTLDEVLDDVDSKLKMRELE